MVEKIDQMVSAQVEAIRNLKIDSITVWDSGGDGDGSSTSNFISNLVKSLPPLHDIASNAGVDLPDYLGSMSDDDCCLLYTSPSPRDVEESRMPSSA